MNLIIFDLCNVTLCFIVIVAAFNLIWHIRFYAHVPKNQEKYKPIGARNENAKIWVSPYFLEIEIQRNIKYMIKFKFSLV